MIIEVWFHRETERMFFFLQISSIRLGILLFINSSIHPAGSLNLRFFLVCMPLSFYFFMNGIVMMMMLRLSIIYGYDWKWTYVTKMRLYFFSFDIRGRGRGSIVHWLDELKRKFCNCISFLSSILHCCWWWWMYINFCLPKPEVTSLISRFACYTNLLFHIFIHK